MASISANSLRSGKRAKDVQGSDPHLSKAVELNGQYRLFFRTWPVEDGLMDIAAAVVPGRSCDFDVCQTSYIPYTKDMYETDEIGVIDDKTPLKSWARIARVLHQAQCIREKKGAEAEAQRTAAELGSAVDPVSLARALEAIEIKFNGGKAADGTNIAPSKQAAISGMQQKMSTQLLVVKMQPNGAPDWKNSKYAVLEISKSRMTELITILDDPNFTDPNKDYLEVQYNYVGADKKSAGQAAKFQGIAESMSLAKMFPSDWETHGKKLVDGIAKGADLDATAEIMRSRNRNLKAGKGANDVISAIKTWCAKNAAVFASINFETDEVSWAAKDFLDSHLVDAIPSVKAKFEAIVQEQEKQKAANGENQTATENTTVLENAANAPAVDPVVEEQKAMATAAALAEAGIGQTIRDVATQMPDIDLSSDDELSDL